MKYRTRNSSVALCVCAAASAAAQAPEQFCAGKQINFIIGYLASSGYDIYARLLATHSGRRGLGQPTIVPQDMSAASNLGATNYVYNRAPQSPQ